MFKLLIVIVTADPSKHTSHVVEFHTEAEATAAEKALNANQRKDGIYYTISRLF